MVYRGKPSRACSECRIKRRKCDLSRPACRQCVRAGSRCDGYRDETLLTFQDQTTEIFCKNPVVTDNQGVALQPGRPYQSKNEPKYDPSSNISVILEEQAVNFFSYHYVVYESGRSLTHPDCHGIIYKRATEPGYLANLINAVGLASLAYMRHSPTFNHAASKAFSRALHGIRVALADPSEAASDQMIVAVMLLALYETVTCNSSENSSSWDRHADGALALIKLRGVNQLRNRIGRGIFLHLRTEILIDCLQRGLPVPTILMNSMAEARNYESAQEAPAARLADIIVNVCDIISSTKDDTTDNPNLSCFVSTLISIDTDLENWSKTLPADYEYTTVTSPSGMADTEAFMGHYDTYSNVEIANTWNLQRCTRIILRQALVETLSKHLHTPSSLSIMPSFPTSCTHLFHTSDTVIQESSTAICYSVPYILHSHDKTGKSSDLPAAYIMYLLWPLYVAGTAHTASDSLRSWIVSTMERAEKVTGIQKAKLVALTMRRQRWPAQYLPLVGA